MNTVLTPGGNPAGPGPSDTTPPWLRPPVPPAQPPSAPSGPQEPNRPPRRWARASLAALLGVGLTVGGGAAGATIVSHDQGTATPAAATVVTTGGAASTPATGSQATVESVAANLLPVVVEITAQGQQGTATGSGVVMRSDGYILTNNHVVEGASQLSVTTSSGVRLDAQLVGAAASNDIAVLKVNQTGMKAATFARSANVRVGQSVIAVGSPFGLSGSVTTGIVSALNRVVSEGSEQTGASAEQQIAGAIQTDAAINPGNSGGALADSTGAVIGINTAIASGGSDSNAGVGFAIPSDQALKVANAIISGDAVQIPYLGVQGTSQVTEQQAQQYGLGNRSGALVEQVVGGGPAASGGLKAGDLVTSVNGTAVTSWDELISAGRTLTIGQSAELKVIRSGRELTLHVTPVARPANP
jgi:putative serine protease PepD